MFKSPVSKIISADNRTFRECLKLKDKKYREREGLFLVEGTNLVDEACSMGDVELVLISDAADYAAPKGVDSVLIKDSLFAKLSDTKTHQGVIAVVKKKS